MAEQHDAPSAGTTRPPAAIQDRRPKPGGVLPRHMQMWLMVGLSLLILGIIFFTGGAEPRPHSPVAESAQAPAALIQPERVRSYQDRLAQQEVRLRRELEERGPEPLPELPLAHDDQRSHAAAVDPFADERRRREYDSLFADNVVLSRRPPDRQTYGERRASSPPRALTPWPMAPASHRPCRPRRNSLRFSGLWHRYRPGRRLRTHRCLRLASKPRRLLLAMGRPATVGRNPARRETRDRLHLTVRSIGYWKAPSSRPC